MQDRAASDRQYPVHGSLSGENVSLHSWSIFHLYHRPLRRYQTMKVPVLLKCCEGLCLGYQCVGIATAHFESFFK